MTVRHLAINVVASALTILAASAQPVRQWILPIADGGDTRPSPPSVHGYLDRVVKGRVNIAADGGDRGSRASVALQSCPRHSSSPPSAELTTRTSFARASMFGCGSSPRTLAKRERRLRPLSSCFGQQIRRTSHRTRFDQALIRGIDHSFLIERTAPGPHHEGPSR